MTQEQAKTDLLALIKEVVGKEGADLYENVMYPMTAKVKARWLKALRSGRFHQLGGVLTGTNEIEDSYGNYTSVEGFCCLGVECKISRLKPDSDTEIVYTSKFGDCDARLRSSLQVLLASANDSGNLDFSAIADAIETIPAVDELSQ